MNLLEPFRPSRVWLGVIFNKEEEEGKRPGNGWMVVAEGTGNIEQM